MDSLSFWTAVAAIVIYAVFLIVQGIKDRRFIREIRSLAAEARLKRAETTEERERREQEEKKGDRASLKRLLKATAPIWLIFALLCVLVYLRFHQ